MSNFKYKIGDAVILKRMRTYHENTIKNGMLGVVKIVDCNDEYKIPYGVEIMEQVNGNNIRGVDMNLHGFWLNVKEIDLATKEEIALYNLRK